MPTRAFAVALAASLAVGAGVRAQCSNYWLTHGQLQGVDGQVKALTMWDPDGAGPLPSRLVAGGFFAVAGASVANRVACWDPATDTWSALGTGVPTQGVGATLALPNGDLVVGGFGTVQRWNGTWAVLGGNPNGEVAALTRLPNGDIVAGGSFGAIFGLGLVPNIARWNGTAWSPLGAGPGGQVRALLTMPNGDVIAGGPLVGGVARWNGATWSAVGAGLNGNVYALALLPNGDVLAGGSFTIPGFAQQVCIARWDGVVWLPVGTPVGGDVRAIAQLPNGEIAIGGLITGVPGTSQSRVARWDGSSWSSLGDFYGTVGVDALAALPNGELVAGGQIFDAAYNRRFTERWNGSSWLPLGAGNDGAPEALLTLSNGDVIAGGRFSSLGGVAVNRIARLAGGAWSPLGTGIVGIGVRALTALPSGGFVAGGSFASAGGVAANNIARWNGSAWAPLGSGTDGPVHGLVTLTNGDVVAVGRFTTAGGVGASNVARWNGAAWQALGSGITLSANPYASVRAAAVLPSGDLVVGGDITSAGGVGVYLLARWDGTAWHAGPGLAWNPTGAVNALLARPTDLIVGGYGLTAGGHCGVVSWNGTSWSPLGLLNGVWALASLPNGDLVAESHRWNGSSWSPLSPAPYGASGAVLTAMTTRANGNLLVGGIFSSVGSAVSAYLAELSTTCPATAIPFGASCASSAGPMALTATSLPWLGGTFAANATGMPANAIALAITGFATASVPLASLLPQGGAGCFLLTTPDVITAALPTAGTLATQIAIPSQPSLIGQVFHHQVIPVELTPTNGLLAVTSTNRLTALIGSF